jgi:signal transduction histidine kinase
MWLRRRWPVGFAATVIVFSVFSTAAASVALIALFTVAVYRRLAVAGLVAAGFALASIGSVLVRSDTAVPNWWQAVLGIACVAAVLAWGMFIRARRQLARTLRDRARRAESERIAEARRHERQRIAREMHDVLAHRLSLLAAYAGALEFRPDAPPDELARGAGVIRDGAHQALEELREVIGVLRDDPAEPEPDRPQPTLADLPRLLGEARAAGTPVRLDDRLADAGTVPDVLGRTVYRVVQEGLTNARKHAPGQDATVLLGGRRGRNLLVVVMNRTGPNGADPDRIPGSGTGLVGLRERVQLAGGRLDAKVGHGRFRLWAVLPWPG